MAIRLWQAETTIVAMLIFFSTSHPGGYICGWEKTLKVNILKQKSMMFFLFKGRPRKLFPLGRIVKIFRCPSTPLPILTQLVDI